MSAFTLILIPGPVSSAPPPAIRMDDDGAGLVRQVRLVRLDAPADPETVTVSNYVARTALQLHRNRDVEESLVLVGHGLAGPFLPALAQTQRVAGRRVAGYVFADAVLPRPGGGSLRELLQAPEEDLNLARWPVSEPVVLDQRLPPAPDWPDAPCGYLLTDEPSLVVGREFWARSARRRDWPVGSTLAEVLQLMPGMLT